MADLQNQDNKPKSKKSNFGKVVTKTALVLGTASIIGYAMIKKKLLGNPASKIRKGLLYATLAGVILYKCQGDKVKEVYDYVSAGAVTVYDDFYELKKNNNLKIEELKKDYEESKLRNSELEDELESYSGKDSIISKIMSEKNVALQEKNYLEEKLRNLDEIKSQNERILKKFESDSIDRIISEKKSEESEKYSAQTPALQKAINKKEVVARKPIEKRVEYSDVYSKAVELEVIFDDCGNYTFVTNSSQLPNSNILWIISDGKMTFNDINRNYYNNKINSGVIGWYNRMNGPPDHPIYAGQPIALPREGLVNKFKVYDGGYPLSFKLEVDGKNLDKIIAELYSEDSKKIDVLEAIKEYNALYGQDLDELKSRAEHLGNAFYFVLAPRCLEYKDEVGYYDYWVNANERRGSY